MGIDATKSKCPGQDTMFWKPGDIYDVTCSSCGISLEFFKDDVSRKCPNCGSKVSNPKLSLGCAQWCEHAKECLGYDPKEQLDEEITGDSIMNELEEAMKREFGADEKRIEHALAVRDHAIEIMKGEGGNPKVIVAAAILHDIGIQKAEEKHGSSSPKYQELEGPAIAERIMKQLEMDQATIYDVKEIVGNHHSARCSITPEFKVIWDADWIVNLASGEYGEMSDSELERRIEKIFRTETGKKRAYETLLPQKNKA